MEATADAVTTHTFKAFNLPLSSVTIFTDRAEVKRLIKVDLKAGINEIVIETVSQSTLPDSIRVDGRGEAIIHEVQFQCKPALASETSSPKVKQIEDERKALVETKSVAEDRQNVIIKQIEALDELITKVPGCVIDPPEKSKAFALEETTFESIKKLMEFYEANSVKVRAQSREVADEIEQLKEKIAKLDAELVRIRCDINNTRNISILMEAEKEVVAELVVSYQVWNANWVPSYDIRVTTGENGKGTVKLSYYGKIRQSSGEDWTDAKLILSTAQPSLGGNLPSLGTLEARFRRAKAASVPYASALFGSVAKYETDGREQNVYSRSSMAPNAASMCSDVQVHNVGAGDTVMSTVFEIPRPTTVLSDNSEHRVTIAIVDLVSTLVYATVPSKSTNVFLMASLTNESVYPFLAGEAAVYFETSFIAKTDLKSVSPGEHFECSLGVDPAVKVQYKPLHKYTEQVGLITKNPCIAHEQKILLKNTKKDSLLITVNEPIPKSTDEKIKIRLISPQLTAIAGTENTIQKGSHIPAVGTVLNKQNHLEWTLRLDPNKEVELIVKYAMEHPSTETVVFQEVF